jgi:hypothetical protein
MSALSSSPTTTKKIIILDLKNLADISKKVLSMLLLSLFMEEMGELLNKIILASCRIVSLIR